MNKEEFEKAKKLDDEIKECKERLQDDCSLDSVFHNTLQGTGIYKDDFKRFIIQHMNEKELELEKILNENSLYYDNTEYIRQVIGNGVEADRI